MHARIRMASKESRINLNKASFFVVNNEINDFTGTLSLSDGDPGRVSGGSIYFKNGVFDVAGKEIQFTGTYDPNSGQQVHLGDGNGINNAFGVTDKRFLIASNSTVGVWGSPILEQDIYLTDTSSVLELGIQSKLTSNIFLNGGTLLLKDDLSLSKGSRFLGSGTIDVNGKTLRISGESVSDSDIIFKNVNDIVLMSNLDLSNKLVFYGAGGTSKVTGNGYGVTFNGTGGVSVGPDHVLYLTDLYLRNFAAGMNQGYFDIDPTSTIVLQNCKIELAGNYDHDKGTILCRGGHSKLKSNGFSFNVNGSQAFIEIDGTVLEYDTDGGYDGFPFSFTNSAVQKRYVNNGAIRAADARSSLLLSSSTDLKRDYLLADDSVIRIENPNPGSLLSVVLDFAGHTVFFPNSGSELLSIGQNVNLTFQNVILNEYNHSAVSYENTNSSMNFGLGTRIKLTEDVVISAADRSWNFIGSGEIVGSGSTLVLDGSNRLTVKGFSSLTLKNLRIDCRAIDALACLDQASKIIFENCMLVIGNSGLAFNVGSIDVLGLLEVCGGDTSSVDGLSKLTFSSKGQFRVLSKSKMVINRGVEFEYKADPSGDGTNTFATKRHFVLSDSTSTLQLDGAVLHSTTTALALDYGRLIIDDVVKLIVDGTGAESCDLGLALDLTIRPGATLELDGQVRYISTNYP